MIKKVYTAGGDLIVASSSQEIVTALREGSRFDSEGTNEQYMYRFCDRYYDYCNKVVRADTADHFVEDLLKYGYLKQTFGG